MFNAAVGVLQMFQIVDNFSSAPTLYPPHPTSFCERSLRIGHAMHAAWIQSRTRA